MVDMIGVVNVLFVNVSVPAKVANVPVVGNVMLVAAVVVNVEAKPPDITKEALVGIVNVPALPVIDRPFIVVAVAAPKVGVVNEGDTRFANVPVTVGKVKETPDELWMVDMIGVVNVLFVNVSVPANVANVPGVGNVILVAAVLVNVEAKPPAITNAALVGIVNVPALPVIDRPFIVVAVAAPKVGVVNEGDTRFANVPVTVGKVKETPDELWMVDMIGVVNVLFVNVSVPAKVANVPVVGNVIFVAAVAVNVDAKPPTIVNLAFVGIVNVPALPVIVRPFIVVAVAAPNVGVVKEGDTRFANVPVTVGKVKDTPDELWMVDIIGVVKVLLVNVSVPANVANVPVVGNVIFVPAVVVNVKEFDGIVNVPALPVIDKPFIVVAVATPNVGVVKEGDTRFANVPVTVGKVKETPDEL